MKPLALALMSASTQIQEAHRVAREAGREDICQSLRKAAWATADALARLAPNYEEKHGAGTEAS